MIHPMIWELIKIDDKTLSHDKKYLQIYFISSVLYKDIRDIYFSDFFFKLINFKL